jgi:hypothetical protein
MVDMSLVRFKLNGIAAFRNKDQSENVRHLCVDCAREARQNHTLIPFLNGQLRAMLSEFGQDLGAMVSCDKCGEVMETYYPEDFWAKNTAKEGEERNPLLFKRF